MSDFTSASILETVTCWVLDGVRTRSTMTRPIARITTSQTRLVRSRFPLLNIICPSLIETQSTLILNKENKLYICMFLIFWLIITWCQGIERNIAAPYSCLFREASLPEAPQTSLSPLSQRHWGLLCG